MTTMVLNENKYDAKHPLDREFVKELLEGPLASMHELGVPEDMRYITVMSLLQGYMAALAMDVNRAYGECFFQHSRQLAQQHGKNFYHLVVTTDDWVRSMEEKTLVFSCELVVDDWKDEIYPYTLAALCAVNIKTHYLLSIELHNSKREVIYYTRIFPLSPRRITTDKLPGIKLCASAVRIGEEFLNDDCCMNCNKALKSPMLCSGCHVRRYCSATCQRFEWPEHKKLCHLLNSLRQENIVLKEA